MDKKTFLLQIFTLVLFGIGIFFILWHFDRREVKYIQVAPPVEVITPEVSPSIKPTPTIRQPNYITKPATATANPS